MSDPTRYVEQLWDDVLLHSALELRNALDLLSREFWIDNVHTRDMVRTHTVLREELLRRGLADLYHQSVIPEIYLIRW